MFVDMEEVVEEYLASKYGFIEVRNIQENTVLYKRN